MTKKVFWINVIFRNAAFVLATGLLMTANYDKVCSQTSAATIDSGSKETDVESKKPNQSVQTEGHIKVVFDETTPGVLIIESNGEKILVDATKKTVKQLSAASPQEKTVETSEQQQKTATVEAAETEEEKTKEENPYDFDPGEEPYDYRLINVPTPKKVPKGTWNLAFNHRFSQPIHPLRESGRNLLGLDSFSVSSFGISYGITDKLYVNAYRSPLCQRGLCRAVELGLGYNWISQDKDSPVALTTYASIEGNGNFTEEYTYNLQTMVSSRIGKRVYLFFSPALHLNANGQRRFNPRAEEFFPPTALADTFHLPKHTVSFGFGTSVLIKPDTLVLFDFTPRVGFKLGRVNASFDDNFNVTGFQNVSYPEIGFGLQKNIGRHSFTLTFSNTQTTTTSRYNSSNLVFSPKKLVIGFNLARRF